jgi:glycine oxidase
MSDVLVAGAGVAGLSVAWRAAQRGLSVTVVDEAPGTGASYAAAGMLAPVAEATYGEEALVALSRASLELYPAFVAELEDASGTTVGLRTAGTLLVGFDEDDVRALDHVHVFHTELGLSAERLPPRACRSQEPALSPRLRGGVRVSGDHSVEPRALHAALLTAAGAAGVEVVHARVGGLVVEDGRTTGLELVDGRQLRAPQTVLALGAWSGRLPGVPQGSVPVRPVKGQILRLQGEPLLEGTVRALVRGRAVYLVPYGADRVVVGATVEEQGFDGRVTAGAVLDLLRDATGGRARADRARARRDPRPLATRDAGQRAPARAVRPPGTGARHRPLPQRGPARAAHRPGGRRRPRRGGPHRTGRRLRRRPVRRRPDLPAGGRMDITVNGDPTELEDGLSVAALVAQRAPDHRRIAVAVNADVVPRSAWPSTVLRDGDAVEVLVAVAGG